MKNQEQKSNIDQPVVGRSTVWQPTCLLRWNLKEIIISETIGSSEKVLEQMWKGDMGEQEWRDIEWKQ